MALVLLVFDVLLQGQNAGELPFKILLAGSAGQQDLLGHLKAFPAGKSPIYNNLDFVEFLLLGIGLGCLLAICGAFAGQRAEEQRLKGKQADALQDSITCQQHGMSPNVLEICRHQAAESKWDRG